MKRNRHIKKAVLAAAATVAASAALMGGSPVNDDISITMEPSAFHNEVISEAVNVCEEEVVVPGSTMTFVLSKIPDFFKYGLAIPLWGLGMLVFMLISNLVLKLTHPFLHFFLKLLILFLILLLIVVIIIKLLFPDMKLKDILTRKLIIAVFAGALFVTTADTVLPLYWEDYRFYRNLTVFCAGLLVLVLILRPFIRKHKESRQKLTIVVPDDLKGEHWKTDQPDDEIYTVDENELQKQGLDQVISNQIMEENSENLTK